MFTITAADVSDDILSIENECFPGESWSGEALNKEILSSLVLVCKNNETPVGYICVSYVLDEAEINRVAVKTSYRDRGLAKALIKEALTNLKSKGINKIFLEVRSNNTVAVKLYQSLGFTSYDLRKKYYSNPIDDALLMSLEI